jgi:hypothetical protein
MDYIKKVVLAMLVMVCLVAVVTTIMSFFGVSTASYSPYMYFIIAMVVLGLFLSPTPISTIG